jgi:hypothetical protein
MSKDQQSKTENGKDQKKRSFSPSKKVNETQESQLTLTKKRRWQSIAEQMTKGACCPL